MYIFLLQNTYICTCVCLSVYTNMFIYTGREKWEPDPKFSKLLLMKVELTEKVKLFPFTLPNKTSSYQLPLGHSLGVVCEWIGTITKIKQVDPIFKNKKRSTQLKIHFVRCEYIFKPFKNRNLDELDMYYSCIKCVSIS